MALIPLGREATPGAELPDPQGWTLGELLDDLGPERVFEARGPSGSGRCAIARRPEDRAECERRSAALSGLGHPQVTGVIAHGTLRGLPYRIDREPQGPTAEVYLERLGAMGPAEVMAIGHSLAILLVELHARGLVHGELGPAAVHLDEAGSGLVPVLARFPLSLSAVGAGTDPFVHQGGAPDPCSDLFGLGITLVSLLRGAPPSERAVETWKEPGTGPAVAVPTGRVEPALFRLLQELVDRDPGRRPRSAVEVRDRLAEMLQPVRRKRWALPLLGGVSLVGLAVAVALLLPEAEPPSAAQPAATEALKPAPKAPPPGLTEQAPALAELQPEEPKEPNGETTDEANTPTSAPPAPSGSPRTTPVVARSSLPPEEASPSPAAEPGEPAIDATPEPEPALVEVESAPEPPPRSEPTAAPDPSRFSGTWTGSANDRPMTLVISVAPDGSLSGSVEQRLGAQVLRAPVSGRCTDQGSCSFSETSGAGTAYSGTLGASSGSGSMSQRGRDRGTWMLTR